MQYRFIKQSIAALSTTLLFGLGGGVAAQMGAEPPQEQGGPGMQQEPGAQRQPGMQQEPGAQRQPGMQQEPGIAPPDPDRSTFSDQQINRFVDAYIEILDIQEEYNSEVQQTKDSEKARKLQEKANDKMVKVIEDNGLSVPEYSEIANAMDMDPELRDEIAAKIRSRK